MNRSVIFITGAASGIGKATAKLFSAKGWFVGATDINEGDLLALKQELSGDCFTAQLDVTSKSQFDEVMARFSDTVTVAWTCSSTTLESPNSVSLKICPTKK